MRYDAFISYRHSDLDMEIAKKVHSGLETYKIPRSVQKSLGKKNPEYTDFNYWKANGWLGKVRPWK